MVRKDSGRAGEDEEGAGADADEVVQGVRRADQGGVRVFQGGEGEPGVGHRATAEREAEGLDEANAAESEAEEEVMIMNRNTYMFSLLAEASGLGDVSLVGDRPRDVPGVPWYFDMA